MTATWNAETQSIALVIDNQRKSLGRALSLAGEATEQAQNCEQVVDGIWTVNQARYFLLIDALKEWITDELDDLPVAKFRDALAAQLVRSAVERVNWHDLADHYLTKLSEQ